MPEETDKGVNIPASEIALGALKKIRSEILSPDRS